MLTRKQYNIIKDGITDGNYKRIRLVRTGEQGEREMLTTYNGYIKGGEQNAVKRLDYIKHQLEKILPAGNYVIEATTTPTGNGGIVDSFHIKKSPVTIPIASGANLEKDQHIEDHTNDQENMAVDIDDLKDLYKELGELRALCKMQQVQIKMLEAENAKKELSEAPKEKTLQDTVVELVKEIAPGAMGMLSDYISNRTKELNLEERKLDLSESAHLNGSVKKKKKIMIDFNNMSREELANSLDIMDDNEFNATVDKIQESNPELYEFICEEFSLNDDDDTEEQTE